MAKGVRGLALAALLACVGCGGEGRVGGHEEALAAFRAGDGPTAHRIYERLAAEGDARAQTMLGVMLAEGTGVPADPPRACDLFERAAAAGIPEAAQGLGDCHFHGRGRARDHELSLRWYQRAADLGWDQALCAMGNQYADGLGVARDLGKAVELCTRAAEAGIAVSQADLGRLMLRTGRHEEARKWLRKAAEQNHSDAARWWTLAARGRHPDAPVLLGGLYFVQALDHVRRIVREEPGVQSAYWYTVAARVDPDEADRREAEENRDVLYALSPGLRAKVEGLLGR